MSETELGYMLQFFRAYPISRPAGKLSWSEHETLLAVNDSEKRDGLAKRAEKENWDRNRLRKEVKALKGSQAPFSETKWSQTPEPGKPGTYRVMLAKSGPFGGELALDLGFSCYYRPAGEFPFKEGDIITSAKDTKGYYSLQSIPSPFPLPRGEGSALVPLPGGEDKGEGALDTHPASSAGGRHPP